MGIAVGLVGVWRFMDVGGLSMHRPLSVFERAFTYSQWVDDLTIDNDNDNNACTSIYFLYHQLPIPSTLNTMLSSCNNQR